MKKPVLKKSVVTKPKPKAVTPKKPQAASLPKPKPKATTATAKPAKKTPVAPAVKTRTWLPRHMGKIVASKSPGIQARFWKAAQTFPHQRVGQANTLRTHLAKQLRTAWLSRHPRKSTGTPLTSRFQPLVSGHTPKPNPSFTKPAEHTFRFKTQNLRASVRSGGIKSKHRRFLQDLSQDLSRTLPQKDPTAIRNQLVILARRHNVRVKVRGSLAGKLQAATQSGSATRKPPIVRKGIPTGKLLPPVNTTVVNRPIPVRKPPIANHPLGITTQRTTATRLASSMKPRFARTIFRRASLTGRRLMRNMGRRIMYPMRRMV